MGGNPQLTEHWTHHDQQVDLLIDLYCDWRDATADVSRAYARYRSAAPADRTLAFAAYGAALDREQAASHAYGLQITRLGLLLAGHGRRRGTARP